MDPQKYLKKNLKFLHKAHPLLAYQISMTDPSDLEFCKTQDDELNLKRIYQGRQYFYHSPHSAKREAEAWFNGLDKHAATVIFVYGVGLGYYYEAAKEWLKQHPHHMLVILEEDLNVLHRLLETEIGTHLLKDRQVQLFYFQDPVEDLALFNEISWSYFECPSIISSLKMYQEENPEGFSQLQHQLSYHIERKRVIVDEYLQYGVVFFRNFYANLLELPTAYSGNRLFGCYDQVPAIICGAGPSLSKNIDLLPSLKQKALVFAGSSSLNALIPKGTIPHFGVAIDPNKYQYSRVAVTQSHHVPFFYRGRLFHEALKAIDGHRLYLTGAGGYETAKWFEKELNIEGEDLDEGQNVVNFSIHIAHALGCNPIILIGVDLAFTNQRFYADGIAANLNIKENDLKKQETIPPEAILRKDIYGKPIHTIWKWISEAEWITKFAQDHPETTFINATEGGLGFKGIENLTLKECANQFLKLPKKEIEQIEQDILQHPFSHIQTEQIFELFQKMKKSLDHCIFLLSRLIEEGDHITENIQQNKDVSEDLQTPSSTLLETNLETEIAYQYLLDMFNEVYLRIHHREYQEIRSHKQKRGLKQRALKKLILQKQRLIFLRDVAHVNREMIQHAESTGKNFD